MKKQEIKDVFYIYSTIILIAWFISSNLNHTKELEYLNNELFQAKSLVVELDKDYSNALEMVSSMNRYADSLESELQTYKYLEKFKKELDRHPNK